MSSVADLARNNAAWCDAVCSAHGSAGELSASHWLCRKPTPPYYPNLVTLDPAPGPAMEAVRELEQALPTVPWAVKDSFGVLALERAGFALLFEAEWIVRPAALGPVRAGSDRDRWVRVETEAALADWEAAWGESAGGARIFLPPLLRRDEIAILARRGDGGAFAAGVIANRSAGVVGLSNFFARENEGALRGECIDAAMRAFPGLSVVGYESGRALEESRALGFRSLGALRVWLRSNATSGSAP
jgi:hypothetical protein